MTTWQSILAIFGLALLPVIGPAACGSKSSGNNNTSTTSTSTGTATKLSFATDIEPIIAASCSFSNCHGTTGAASKVFENNESDFDGDKANCVTYLTVGFSDQMPKAPNANSLSATDRQTLLSYCQQ